MDGESECCSDWSQKEYIAIDLKSFYASVEAAERGLDPLDVNLVVADESRTDKTICLAVSPSLKAIGVPGRARLFEARQRIREANSDRLANAPGHVFTGSSVFSSRLAEDPSMKLDMIIAPPRMRLYLDYSRRIVEIYMRYVSSEDILIYSVDEVFIDATPYLRYYGMNSRQLAMRMIRDVLDSTHITATVGIGTNMYLAKVAMDIVAKKMPADSDGVRIAELDEMSYRQRLWCHRPLTDFWRIGNGIARKLEKNGIFTMGDIARCSEGTPNCLHNESLLYRLFGVNAELLIDHAWGWEPAGIADCKAYTPQSRSLSSDRCSAGRTRRRRGERSCAKWRISFPCSWLKKGFLPIRPCWMCATTWKICQIGAGRNHTAERWKSTGTAGGFPKGYTAPAISADTRLPQG